MSLAARATQVFDDVVTRLRIAADDVIDSRPVDSALHAVSNLLGSTDEREELLARIGSLEAELEVLRRRDRVLSHTMSKLDEEQRLAMRIQQDFLPKSMPGVGPIRFHAAFKPAHYVSGDLYDVARLDEKHVGIYLADAVGHGMPAALLTMFMRNALVMKQIDPAGYRLLNPSETISKLNHALRSQNLSSSSFATAIYARVNCHAGEVCFARGGHPAPILLRPDGTMKEVDCDGSLLGIFDDEQWPEACITLSPGERLVFYSDGIEHAFAETDSVGGTAWKEELLKRATQPTESLLADYAASIESRTGQSVPRDDLTIVVAEYAA